jgi:uncharacterized protein (DUF58 family)
MFRKRGIYAVGPAKLESGDLFGLFENSKEEGPIELLTVFPDLLDFSQLQLPAEDPFGDRRSRRRIFEDPNQPIGVRNYHPEDSFRRIHWPMTAHTGELQVKVYQPSSANVLVVCLNVSTFSRHWEGTNSALLEHLIKVTATLVNKGIQDGYRVGLIAMVAWHTLTNPSESLPVVPPDSWRLYSKLSRESPRLSLRLLKPS